MLHAVYHVYLKTNILWQPLGQSMTSCRQLSMASFMFFSKYLQVPRTSELYVHRSGRTARATNEGLSLLLIGPDDLINFRKIYKTLEKSEELPFFPVDTKCMTSIKVKKQQSFYSLNSCLLIYVTAFSSTFCLGFR